MSHSQSLPTLKYADPPSRWGITVQRHRTGLRVVVPPVPSWWHLPKSYWAVVVICSALAALFSFKAVGIASAPNPSMFVDAALYGFVALAAIAHAFWRLRHRVVFDITSETFALAFVSRSGRGRRAIWRRCEVREVTANFFNGKLLIRIADRDFIEHPICPDREVVKWVADIVRTAVFNGGFDDVTAAGAAEELFPGPRPPVYGSWPRAIATLSVLFAFLATFIAFYGRSHFAFALLILSFVLVLTLVCGITYSNKGKDLFM